jgi:hypothetical protein
MNLTVIWCFLLEERKDAAVIGGHRTEFSRPGDLAPGIHAPLFDIFKEVFHSIASASPSFPVTPPHPSFSCVLYPTHGVTRP